MSEDLTQKLRQSDRDAILTAIKSLDTYVRSSIDNLVTWIKGIDSRLHDLEKTVEERLDDTRPIWHRVVADISQLQAGQQRLEQGQQAMRNDLSNVSRDQIVINDSIRKIQLDYHAIDDRLHQLEVNRN